jgi:hypothetical protein
MNNQPTRLIRLRSHRSNRLRQGMDLPPDQQRSLRSRSRLDFAIAFVESEVEEWIQSVIETMKKCCLSGRGK